jgi:glutathione peroxidase
MSYPKPDPNKFYEFEVLDIDKQPFSFHFLRGKVVLIVNVASKSGFTPQFASLQKLHEKYSEKGISDSFEIKSNQPPWRLSSLT